MQADSPQPSYDQHPEDEKRTDLPSCYTDPESVDAWRHNRMLKNILPLVRMYPHATWMTIGDGRYGSEAFFLRKQGINVIATSLSDATLKVAFQQGYIGHYRMENAEQLSIPDNTYDFVLCKESYHHFRRPPIAFYEMLRVAKRAVILIEPADDKERAMDFIKRAVKRMLRGDSTFMFEAGGNFIYRVNIHEIGKMIMGLGASCMAVKQFNDFYYRKVAHNSSAFSPGSIVTKMGIVVQDIFCYLRLMNYGLAAVVVFKADIGSEIMGKLKEAGFRIVLLPRNPYS